MFLFRIFMSRKVYLSLYFNLFQYVYCLFLLAKYIQETIGFVYEQ